MGGGGGAMSTHGMGTGWDSSLADNKYARFFLLITFQNHVHAVILDKK